MPAKEFSFSRLAYGLVEGVGVNASYNVTGYAALSGSNTVHVFASGQCAAQQTRHWCGSVTAYDASGNSVGRGNFAPLKGPSLTDPSRETIGEVDVQCSSKPVSLGISAYYVTSGAAGGSAPMASMKEERVTL